MADKIGKKIAFQIPRAATTTSDVHGSAQSRKLAEAEPKKAEPAWGDGFTGPTAFGNTYGTL